MWLGERITERGLGNGISLIIMIGILAQFPQAFAQEVVGRMGPGGGGLVLLLVEVVLWVLIIAGCILLVQGTRRIPCSSPSACRATSSMEACATTFPSR
jgi:preprotein translocase subunit SecY